MTLSIDGSNTAPNSTTVTITTTKTNNIIILFSAGAVISGPYDPVTSVTDAAGLTWHHELGPVEVGSGSATFIAIDVWWAFSSGILTGNTITAHGNGGDGRLMVMAVNGANTTTPFDVNANANLSNTSATSVTSLAIINSTSNANCMLIEFSRFANGSGAFTNVPSGFTSVLSGGSFTNLYSSIVSSVQNSVTNTFQWSGGSPLAMVLVSIQAASTGGPFPHFNRRNMNGGMISMSGGLI